jgi:uncharacterized protein with HEPN domain
MHRDDSVYLKHIRDAIMMIEEYTEGIDKLSFLKNTLVQDAVIRQIEIIGEASKRLSDTIRENTPNIPWQDIAGMRDKLIHDYMGVDIETVWLTVRDDIPTLKKHIKNILENY